MIATPNAAQRRRVRLIFGGLLCSLVFFFSLAAKVEMPQPGKAFKPIASLKMQRKIAGPILQAAPSVAVSVAFFFLFALAESFAAPTGARFSLAMERQAPAFRCWFSPYLSVRPPPSI